MGTATEDSIEFVVQRQRRRRRDTVPWLVFVCALVVTVAVALWVQSREAARDREYFENAVQSAQDRARSRIASWGELVRDATWMFALGDGQSSPEEFRDYVQRLDLPHRFPGVESVGYALRLGPDESPAVLRAAWGLPPEVPLDGAGPDLEPILLIEPLDRPSRLALGVTYPRIPDVREAMQRATDSGEPVLTPMIALAGSDELRPTGFLLVSPIYGRQRALSTAEERRQALEGHVVVVLRAPAFFLGFFGTEAAPRVAFELFDGPRADPTRRIFRSWSPTLEGRTMPFQADTQIGLYGGHVWTLRIVGRGASAVPVLPFVLATGFASAALLFLAMLFQVRGRHAAELAASELSRSARSLHRSERRLRTLIERLPEAVAVYQRGRVVFCNPGMELMLRSTTPLVGREAEELVAAEDRPSLRRALESLDGTGGGAVSGPRRIPLPGGHPGDESGPSALAEIVPLDLRFLSAAGGEAVHTEGFLLPLDFDGAPAVLGVWRDVTQRRQLAARMMQMDRMIAVGTLAAGVAHEINNPLAYVTANLDYALEELPRVDGPAGAAPDGTPSRPAIDGEVLQALREARDGAERVRRIVRDLKTFSRGVETDPAAAATASVDVRRAITWATAMADNEIRHRARLEVEVGDVSAAACDEARLGQVLLNLLMNAAQAISEGAADRNRIRVVARDAEDGQVVVSVTDSGQGIAPENLPRIFDPFFTTKPVGEGTGLGLAIAQRIITSYGGELRVSSEPGRGSTFEVRLKPSRPAPRRAAPADAPAHRHAGAPAGGEEDAAARPRVLLVDDEVPVLRAIARALEATFEVVGISRADEALARLRGGERFDAVVCDLMMPEMTGVDLHAALLADGSAIARRMIFITGGAFTSRAAEFLASVDNPRLEKPFDTGALIALLRRVAPAQPSPRERPHAP